MTGRALTADGLRRIEALFREHLARGYHPGAQLAVCRDGALLVDLAGGEAKRGRPLTNDAPMLLFSATKPIMAVCIHLLAERGALRYDDPVARYWPEFAQRGKHAVTVRHVLTHRGGFPQVAAEFDWRRAEDWEYVTAQTAALPAAWAPGAEVGYHPVTYGWALGELARRIDGRMPRALMREEVFAPLGIAGEIALGCADEAALAARVPVHAISEVTARDPEGRERSTSRLTLVYNGSAVARAQLPAANGYGTARALARFYASLLPGGSAGGGGAEGRTLLRPETIAEAVRVGAETAHDRTQETPKRYGLGFYLSGLAGDPFDYHEGAGVFGHAGQQSSVGYADPRHGLAVAYVTNGLHAPDVVYRRMAEMAAAVRAACVPH